MSYIFMDESGDLGFNFNKKKTSRYFVVTFLFASDKNIIGKLVKNIFKVRNTNTIQLSKTITEFCTLIRRTQKPSKNF